MSYLDDWSYKIIRACGLSTANSDVNIIGLHQCIKEIMSVKELTNDEIEVLASKHLCYQIEGSEVSGVFDFARAILRKAQEK